MTDLKIQKWTRWCDGPIKSDVLAMHLQRDAWLDVAALLAENPSLPESYWWEFMRDTYATTQTVAVRRQADRHKDAGSLGKLIEEIRDDSDRLTKQFWLDLWSDDDHGGRAEGGWAEQYAGDVDVHLDPSIPAADLKRLLAASRGVKNYVDEHVAHSEARAVPTEVTLTLDEVHGAIDVIGELLQTYYNLLTGDALAGIVPVIQHDWKAVFRQPWIAPQP